MNKIMTILGDTDKSIELGPDVTCDNTKSIELKFQKCLIELIKDKAFPVYIYEAVKSAGSVWP